MPLYLTKKKTTFICILAVFENSCLNHYDNGKMQFIIKLLFSYMLTIHSIHFMHYNKFSNVRKKLDMIKKKFGDVPNFTTNFFICLRIKYIIFSQPNIIKFKVYHYHYKKVLIKCSILFYPFL